MSYTLKINTKAYNGLKKDDFGSFGTNVAAFCKDNPTYSDQSAAVTDVENKAADYALALTAFNTNRGKDRTTDLKNARLALKGALGILVGLLNASAPSKPNPEAFLTGPGFTLAKVPSRRTGTVRAPIKQSAVSGGKNAPKGMVKFVLKAEFPEEIIAIIGKRSDDNGLTWVEGIVATKLSFTLTGQPSGKNCIYMFMFKATNNRESLWSANMSIDIY